MFTLLNSMKLENGVFIASPSEHYRHVWIRDNFYMSLPYLELDCGTYEGIYHAFLDMFKRYEWKLDAILAHRLPPEHKHEYIHSRYSCDLEEIDEPWGHIQNDAIGAFFVGVALGESRRKNILRDGNDKRIITKLVEYLKVIRYWQCPDSGMWEENEEIHLSSLGACVAGLKGLKQWLNADVKDWMIDNGIQAMYQLLPRESKTKSCDLAQLSCIWPYNLLNKAGAMKIIKNVETNLLRDRGIIRYEGDRYYNNGVDDPWGNEAEWAFGLPWLALAYWTVDEKDMAQWYLQGSKQFLHDEGNFPELYYAKTNRTGPNTPLGWTVAMHMMAAKIVGGSKLE